MGRWWPAMLLALAGGVSVSVSVLQAEEQKPVYDPLRHTVQSIDGQDVALSRYRGRVVLIVNVASRCGYTKQYADLQALHAKYAAAGLAVLGFPCNQFGAQEPGSEQQIKSFCKTNYNVSFDLFRKIDVDGEQASPLYRDLTSEQAPIEDRGAVKWNFEKFLLDREGKLIARYRSGVKPTSEEIVKAIESALAEPAASKD